MTRTDTRVLLAFLCFALAYFLLVWNGASPYVYVSGDTANTLSVLAAMAHPGAFAGDPVFGDPANYAFYRIVHIPLTRWLAGFTGDYGTAYCLLLAPVLFLHLAGYYLLGRLLFPRPLHAALFSLLALVPISLGMGEYWGAHRDAQARLTFSALLPWLLAGAWLWRARPLLWPVLLLGAGALTYVHSLSAPVWGLALWLGMWGFLPARWSPWRKLAVMAATGAAFVLVMAPFALRFFAGNSAAFHGDRAELLEAMRVRLRPGSVHVWDNVREFFTPGLVALLAAGAAAVALLRAAGGARREGARLIGAWAAGVVGVSVGLTWLLGLRHADGGVPSLDFFLVRGLRYLIPLALLALVWALVVWAEGRRAPAGAAGRGPLGRRGAVLAVLLAAVVVGGFRDQLWRRTAELRHGHFFSLSPERRDYVAALDAVRQRTAPGAKVLVLGADELPVRYYALHPLVYSWKDGGFVVFGDKDGMIAWWRAYQEHEAIRRVPDPTARLRRWEEFSRTRGGTVLLLSRDLPEARALDGDVRVLYANDHFVLAQLSSGAGSGPGPGSGPGTGSGTGPADRPIPREG
jgi:hypothetical protein